jgi:small subunit ribosomal protein S17
MAKTIVGTVTSNKTDKTIVVTTHTRKTHPLYRKQYTVTTKFMAHDEQNECQPGDKVSIVETRPLSARKRYTLDKIIEKPKLRADSLAAIKSDDEGGQRDSKSSKDEAETETEAVKETKTPKKTPKKDDKPEKSEKPA